MSSLYESLTSLTPLRLRKSISASSGGSATRSAAGSRANLGMVSLPAIPVTFGTRTELPYTRGD